MEVLEALEDALRADTLSFLTCTSTLTEGINLPVHTVVIHDENYAGMPPDLRLKGPRLVNAAGRAGRAGKETGGWIVLVGADRPSDADFADLTISSVMTDDETFAELATSEEQARDDQDAVLRTASADAADFVSFVWFYLADAESRGISPAEADIEALTTALLADPPYSTLLVALARQGRDLYQRTDPSARRRRPRTGTSIGSAQKIDRLAHRIARLLLQSSPEQAEALRQANAAMEVLTASKALEELLALPENTDPWRFRATSAGADIPVPVHDVLLDRLHGLTYAGLADKHLVPVHDTSRRVEEMVDAVTGQFEHFLTWTAGALVELVNALLIDADSDRRLCPELGSYIRYGVDDRRALAPVLNGLRSRRLAREVTRQMPADSADETSEVGC
ncbi:hypothetical protein ACFQ08_05250 [Streptosporangium algeriense]|uniref:Helicase C-terminal domain-containing protein n=1 Tax=Streptosporangium algeriense TaxID=1682748 RepID=A0ABW3DLX8_9ACTN